MTEKLINGIFKIMSGIRKADKLYLIQVSFTVRHINNKKNMIKLIIECIKTTEKSLFIFVVYIISSFV